MTNKFQLSRHYSIASLVGVVAILVVLSLVMHKLAVNALVAQQTRSNIDLTRSYANSTWQMFEPFVAASSRWTPEQLRSRPELFELQRATREQMLGMNVVKVKVYNLQGMTVFSTEERQIGEDKSASAGFMAARRGEAVSELSFRDQFNGLEGVIVDRDLVSSYIPVRATDDAPIQGVFEVYADVTPLLHRAKVTQYQVVGAVAVALALLYLFLFLIVRRADAILGRQDDEQRASSEKIRHQAYHDPLTGLPNRSSFGERMHEAVSRARRHGTSGALLFLDLDRFKLINDSLGHDAGDELLRVTARRVQQSLRECDIAFRLSGDEFVVILEDLDRPECAALAAQRILEAMEQPVNLGGNEVIVSASIGVSHFDRAGKDVEALMKEADLAMYRAKQVGRNQYEFYTKEMNTVAHERLALENDLHRAMHNGEFVLHYQPKVEPGGNRIVSVEALLRWNHPKRGMVSPGEFIPLLEEIGLIISVGQWVLLEACRQGQVWRAAGLPPVRVSVNISGRQFMGAGLVESLQLSLEETGLAPSLLELELTESMFIENTGRSISLMQELRRTGVSLSIDDFGSGYSSLAYLRQFPVNFLKIDRLFVREIETSEQDRAIIHAISTLARSLSLTLVAEGVETPGQARVLAEAGCHELQGYLFGRPMPPEELTEMLRRQAQALPG